MNGYACVAGFGINLIRETTGPFVDGGKKGRSHIRSRGSESTARAAEHRTDGGRGHVTTTSASNSKCVADKKDGVNVVQAVASDTCFLPSFSFLQLSAWIGVCERRPRSACTSLCAICRTQKHYAANKKRIRGQNIVEFVRSLDKNDIFRSWSLGAPSTSTR